jgi:hypothetical protein
MIDPATLLANIPESLREELIERYREIARNFIEHRWEPAELNGGKFAEVAYSIVLGAISGTFPSHANKPPDFVTACRALESRPANTAIVGDKSLRVLIARQLVALYEIRNNRGVGHVGGDVNPNAMDATAVFSVAGWVLAELIRIFHGVSTSEAQAAVDQLAERTVPIVWIVPGIGIKRVLDAAISAPRQTLLLLHVSRGWVLAGDLLAAVEYKTMSEYRKKVLRPLHAKRLIEFDPDGGRAHITPTGAIEAESIIAARSALT